VNHFVLSVGVSPSKGRAKRKLYEEPRGIERPGKGEKAQEEQRRSTEKASAAALTL